MQARLLDKMKFDATKLVYTWFYLGLSPVAPGTLGTIGAIPLVLLLHDFGPAHYLMIIFQIYLLGLFAAEEAEIILWESDPKCVVIDEVVGFAITMLGIMPTWKSLAIGFILFRILDIFKPFPISWCDRNIKGGFGIMFDDVLAGLLACLSLHLLARYISF